MPWHDPTVFRRMVVGPRHGVAQTNWGLIYLIKKIILKPKITSL